MTLFQPSAVQIAVNDALGTLEAGGIVTERKDLDLKEEAGRRGAGGVILPGARESLPAVDALYPEVACMANTPGGGALLVGVADDSSLIGTELDPEWLRSQLYQRAQRRLTVDVRSVMIRSTRLLVLLVPEALEPVRHKNRISWRVGDTCTEIDATMWHDVRRRGLRSDWSAEMSNHSVTDARETAVEIARDFLRASGETRANTQADEPTHDLLRRLNAVDNNGQLTNAAALLFIGRGTPSIDYIRRDHAGGDSVARVRIENRSLLEELRDVFTTAQAYNPTTHISEGLAHAQLRQIPERSLREAIVNGVAHREWGFMETTVVEHIGGTLVVTSPGGFVTDVTASNIINHPSTSRNTALVELLASLRVAEREGVGVDRMYGDMLRLGCPVPEIDETEAPSVRTVLIGNNPARGWRAWLSAMSSPSARDDLRQLMTLAYIVEHGWADQDVLAPHLQVTTTEARDTLDTLRGVTVEPERRGGDQRAPVIFPITGTPTDAPPAFALGPFARTLLTIADRHAGFSRAWPSRDAIALSYARSRGRISSTELGHIVGAAPSNLSALLASLADDGLLLPSRPTRRGAGFHYLPDARTTHGRATL